MTCYPRWIIRRLAGVVFGSVLGLTGVTSGWAATGTWTNYVPGGSLSDYWTNNASWSPTITGHPGTNVNENAFLTNSVALAYTNILNARINQPILNLAISNTLGEAWLIITNTALTNATSGVFALGDGGRLQVDNGGVFTQQTSATVAWRGTNGTIYLNNGGKLFTAAAVTIGSGISNVNATVSSLSGPGLGGSWSLNNQALTIGNGAATGNVLTVTGAVINNAGVVVIGNGAGANGNHLILSNTTLLSSDGTIGFGGWSNSLSVLSGATWNMQGANKLIVGSDTLLAANNTLFINGGLVTNVGLNGFQIGLEVAGNAGGNSNRVVISNGGKLFIDGASQAFNARIGQNSRYNQVIVADTGSVLSVSKGMIFGEFSDVNSGNNSLIVSNGARATVGAELRIRGNSNVVAVTGLGSTFTVGGLLQLGNAAGHNNNSILVGNGGVLQLQANALNIFGSDQSVLVTGGGVFTNMGALSFSGNRNSVIASNGGKLFGAGAITFATGNHGNTFTMGGGFWNQNNTLLAIGGSASASTNTFSLLGGMLSNAATVAVGSGAGAHGNRLILSNATLLSSFGTIGALGASTNSVTVLNGATWNLGGGERLDVGTDSSVNNTLFVNGGVVTNLGLTGGQVGLIVGRGTGGGNRVEISNGGKLFVDGPGSGGFNVLIGVFSQNNQVLVTDPGSVLSASAGLVFGITGGSSSAGSFIVSNGAQVALAGGLLARITGNSTVVTGPESVLSLGGVLQLGSAAGHNNNSVLIDNGGLLQAHTLTIFAGTTGNTISNVGGIYQFTNAALTITPLVAGNIAITDGTISFRNVNNLNVSNSLIGGSSIGNIRFAGANTLMFNASSNTTATGQNYTFQQVIGSPSNYVNLVMVNGHTAYRGGNLTIGNTGSLLVSNTTATISGLLTNTGSLSVVNAQATFQQRVYNSGTIQMLNSSATFISGAINTGHWITDPTTNIFNGFGLTNAASGAIQMAAGDVYIFNNTVAGAPANFINVSTNKSDYNTLEGKMLFSGGLGLTQTLAVAGHDLGPAAETATNVVFASSGAPGFVNNFALGTLEVSNFSTVRVTDAFLEIGTNDFLTAGLYLENLFLGVNSLLIIDTNVQVYFKNSNAWSLANIRLVNNQGLGGDLYSYDNTISGLHQIVIIPEPSVLLLCVVGFVTVWANRRKRKERTTGCTG